MVDETQGMGISAGNSLIDAVGDNQSPVESQHTTPGATENQSDNSNTSQSWEWSPGVPGEGEPPSDWKREKYKYPTDQIKAYNELRKKLSGFTGAPETYEFDLAKYGDAYKEIAPLLDPDGAQFKEFVAFAKEANMNQEYFNKCIDTFVKGQKARLENDTKMVRDYKQAELKKLGDNPSEVLRDFQNWVVQNIDGFDEKRAKKLMLNHDTIEAFNKLRSKMPNVTINKPSDGSNSKISEKEIYEIISDKRYQTDQGYRRSVQPRLSEYFKNKK